MCSGLYLEVMCSGLYLEALIRFICSVLFLRGSGEAYLLCFVFRSFHEVYFLSVLYSEALMRIFCSVLF